VASRHFRAGVVAVIGRADGAVLAFERADVSDSWQLPQGGIEPGEEAVDAVWRELLEETGLGPGDVTLVAEHPDWVPYEWPLEIRTGRKGIGQVQRWFTFSVVDEHVAPRPDGSEFTAWRWVDRQWLVDNVAAFRAAAYRRVLLP